MEYRGGGGGVTAPILLTKYKPEYSEEARKSRLQGTVLLRIEVDTHGTAQNITVRRSLGLGLDDRAIEAVKKWKFSPGKVNGKLGDCGGLCGGELQTLINVSRT